jgi:hypothetical protein
MDCPATEEKKMPVRLQTLSLLVGATLAVTTSFIGTASASCAPRVTAGGSGTSHAQAFANAVAAWEAKVANTINDLYSDWGYARHKQSTSRFLGRKHLVYVRAQPCNS